MSTRPGDTASSSAPELHVLPPIWTDETILELAYRAGDESFVETIVFPEPIPVTDRSRRLVHLLAVAAGVSYSKAVGATNIVPAADVELTTSGVDLADALYDEGMREFAYTSGLPIPTGVTVAARTTMSASDLDRRAGDSDRVVIPFGAGRDSTMLAARLAPLAPVLFKVGEDPHSRAVADELDLRLVVARRDISPRLLELNAAGAPNGHVPVTAINSLIAVIYADAAGYCRVAMANERASSSPTAIVDGHEVNHQYSKSAQAEGQLRAAIAETGSPVDYFSALRSWTDDRIGAAFATLDIGVQRAFMSCNRAFIRDPDRRSAGWCGRCPKCASTFLSLAPHLSPERMTSIFGVNMLADPELIEAFRGLVTDSDKPYECVADVDEARYNLGLLNAQPAWADAPVVTALAASAAPIAPDLSDIPGDDSNVPADIRELLAGAAVR